MKYLLKFHILSYFTEIEEEKKNTPTICLEPQKTQNS